LRNSKKRSSRKREEATGRKRGYVSNALCSRAAVGLSMSHLPSSLPSLWFWSWEGQAGCWIGTDNKHLEARTQTVPSGTTVHSPKHTHLSLKMRGQRVLSRIHSATQEESHMIFERVCWK
jgi:hypothetical protein